MWKFREKVCRAETDEAEERLVPEQEPKLETCVNAAIDSAAEGGNRSDCVTLEVEGHLSTSSSSQSTDEGVASEATENGTKDSEADIVEYETAQVHDNYVLECEAAQRQARADDNTVLVHKAAQHKGRACENTITEPEAAERQVAKDNTVLEPEDGAVVQHQAWARYIGLDEDIGGKTMAAHSSEDNVPLVAEASRAIREPMADPSTFSAVHGAVCVGVVVWVLLVVVAFVIISRKNA